MEAENHIGALNPDDQGKRPPASYRWILLLVLIVLAGVVTIVAWRSAVSPRGQAIDNIVNEVIPANLKPLGNVILTNFTEFRDNSTRWSAAYFSCLLFSAVFSAFAAFVLKVKAFSTASVAKEDLSALLATLAALLITLSTAGDFQRKWQANRIAAADTEELAYELLKTPFNETDKDNVIKKLKEIASTRNREIVGDKPAARSEDQGNRRDNSGGNNSNTTAQPSPTANSNSNKP